MSTCSSRGRPANTRIGDEIDPQFRIASAEGDYWIALTLPEDAVERARRMNLVSDFMALKSSPAFVLATEIKEPDAIVAIGVAHAERVGVLSRHKPGAPEVRGSGVVG
jgi:hypothetical protein